MPWPRPELAQLRNGTGTPVRQPRLHSGGTHRADGFGITPADTAYTRHTERAGVSRAQQYARPGAVQPFAAPRVSARCHAEHHDVHGNADFDH